jgi:hypothetical protein
MILSVFGNLLPLLMEGWGEENLNGSILYLLPLTLPDGRGAAVFQGE